MARRGDRGGRRNGSRNEEKERCVDGGKEVKILTELDRRTVS